METAVQQAVCGSCGNPMLPDGEFCLFCGDVLTEKSGKAPTITDHSNPQSVSGPDVPVEPEYAGFWLRVWAGAIDVFIEAIGAALLSAVVYYSMRWFVDPSYGLTATTASYVSGIAAIVLLSVGAWLYCAFSESSGRRATLGKRMMGLQVVTAQGDRLNFGQATVRHFMKFLSLFTAAVGFMMAGWTRRRQALHDMPTDTLVIRVAPPSLSLFGR
jgi:uncharacterized RDD family membrane protein YckC